MKCPVCGNELSENDVFCGECGTKVVEMAAKAEQMAAEAVANTEEAVADAQESVEAVATEAQETVEEAAAEAQESVEAVAAEAQETVEEAAAEAQESVEAAAAEAQETVEEAAAEVQETVEAGAATAAEAGKEAGGAVAEKKSDKPAEKKGKNKTALIIGGIVGFFVLFFLFLIVVILIVLFAPKKINMNDYATVQITGYDTAGEAYVVFDKVKFEKDYGKKIKRKSDGKTGAAVADDFLNTVKYTVDVDENLSNGDKVKITWECPDEIKKKFKKYRIKENSKTYKVKNLDAIQNYDPFSELVVSFEGYDTQGHLNYRVESMSHYEFNVVFDKTEDLSNGDQVTAEIKSSSDLPLDTFTKKYGYVVSNPKKTYTVEGLTKIDIVDLFDGVEVTFDGYQGNGTATLNYSDANTKYGFTYSIDKSSELSNGDVVTVSVNSSSDYVDRFLLKDGKKAEKYEMQYTVSGLGEMKEFDPFDGLELIFTGTTPFGRVEVDDSNLKFKKQKNGDKLNYRINLTEKGSLSNGDSITVSFTAAGGDFKKECAKYGLIPKTTEKEYTVSGLWEYVESASVIPKEEMTKIETKCKEFIEATFAEDYESSKCEIVSMTKEGSVTLMRKAPSNYNTNENFYLVYKMVIKDEYSNELTYYTTFGFKDLQKNGDDTNANLNDDPMCPSSRVKSQGSRSYDYNTYLGYETLDDLKRTLITANKDAYSIDTDIEELK